MLVTLTGPALVLDLDREEIVSSPCGRIMGVSQHGLQCNLFSESNASISKKLRCAPRVHVVRRLADGNETCKSLVPDGVNLYR